MRDKLNKKKEASSLKEKEAETVKTRLQGLKEAWEKRGSGTLQEKAEAFSELATLNHSIEEIAKMREARESSILSFDPTQIYQA